MDSIHNKCFFCQSLEYSERSWNWHVRPRGPKPCYWDTFEVDMCDICYGLVKDRIDYVRGRDWWDAVDNIYFTWQDMLEVIEYVYPIESGQEVAR